MGDIMQQQLTQALEAYLQKLDDEARIEAINAFRQVLHHYSPFRSSSSSKAHRRIRLSMVFTAMSWPAAKPR